MGTMDLPPLIMVPDILGAVYPPSVDDPHSGQNLLPSGSWAPQLTQNLCSSDIPRDFCTGLSSFASDTQTGLSPVFPLKDTFIYLFVLKLNTEFRFQCSLGFCRGGSCSLRPYGRDGGTCGIVWPSGIVILSFSNAYIRHCATRICYCPPAYAWGRCEVSTW